MMLTKVEFGQRTNLKILILKNLAKLLYIYKNVIDNFELHGPILSNLVIRLLSDFYSDFCNDPISSSLLIDLLVVSLIIKLTNMQNGCDQISKHIFLMWFICFHFNLLWDLRAKTFLKFKFSNSFFRPKVCGG